MLTRDQILAAKDRASQVISVPEWGGEVTITAMTARERCTVDAEFVRIGHLPDSSPERVSGIRDLQLRMVAFCLTDAEGAPLFTQDDVVELGKKSPQVIGRLADEVTILNGLAAKATEDAAKN